ncbi:NAD(P)/FAD-dependent oxidoreductase [Nakamurella flavida]
MGRQVERNGRIDTVSLPDVCVVGSGPNGLAAAVTMARAGLSVQVFEANDTLGGGARTAEITVPGYHHDLCSAVHPMALASPFFKAFQLADRVDFVTPDVSYAHAFSPGRAGVAYRDLERTAVELGADGKGWRDLFAPLVRNIDGIVDFATDQLLRIPRHPVAAALMGLRTLEQGSPLWNARFVGQVAPAMLTGVNTHSLGIMPSLSTAGAGLLLATLAHSHGWPVPIGGSQAIANALADDLRAHGGEIHTGVRVDDLGELPPSRVTLLDTSARALLLLAGDRLPDRYRAAVGRFRYGDGAAKVDFALSEPVPWTAKALRDAPTIHLGGSRRALAASEADVARGRYPAEPYLLMSQPSLLDPTRAPAGGHVLWAYTHVPRGSRRDMLTEITDRIETFAPGFRDVVVGSASSSAAGLEAHNANYIGGDFSAGAVTAFQLVKRPVISAHPWRTPLPGVYLCSSSTPPGPGVNGMAGWHAARLALKDLGLPSPDLAPAVPHRGHTPAVVEGTSR